MDAAVASRCTELNTAISRLSLLSAHDAIQRTEHDTHVALLTVRRRPSCTLRVQQLVENCIFVISNLDLSDLQWLQASLLTKEGGRHVTSLAPAAFLPFSTRRRYRDTSATAPTS